MRPFLLPLIFLITFVAAAQAGDWPGFRGPNADGISPERGINKDWNQKTPRILWKVALTDNGNAAPAVANGQLYIVDHQGAEDSVRALDAATGKDLWHFNYPDADTNRYGFTVNTPLVVGDKLYVYSRKGKIHCLNAARGELLWNRDLASEYPGPPPPWGFCMSPVVDNQTLLLGVSGSSVGMVALDKETGKTIWEAGDLKVSYASPVVATLHGSKQYLVFGVEALYSLDPANGKTLWQLPWPTKFGGKKGPTPVLVGNRIFIATTEGGETGMIDLSSGTPVVIWKHKEIQDHFTTPIFYHGCLFGSSDPKFLACLDPATGKIFWKQETGQYTSVLGVDDTVIALSGKTGELFMIDATTAPNYLELGRCTPLGGTSWVAPILANGHLYIRNQKELACVDLK